jgi:redox-sensitive bicupin YhaK (pirin superfamily)
MKTLALAALVLAPANLAVADQSALIQNNRVTVWDVAPGAPVPATSRDVVIFVIPGNAAVAQATALYRVKGAAAPPLPAGARAIVIELQDAKVASLANTTGYPLAFPRPGSKKVLENDRVVVWSFTWTPGVATPMHFHDKDVVVTYLADGALTSTDPQGKAVVNEHHFAYTKFNARDRVHTETLTRGQASALMVELK